MTAQKREQSISDVPMSISVLSGQALQDRGIEQVADFARSVPAFTYTESRVGTPIYTLRGVGFNDIALGGRPTVSVYVDEVPIPFAIETRGGFLDLERVEVLKGPQGTLFGQNATGGAINLIAAKPTDEFTSGVKLEYGRFGAFTVGGFASGSVSDSLKVRVAAEHEGSDDWQQGYLTSFETGAQDLTTARLLFDWTPTDRLGVSLNVNGYIDQSESQAPQLSGIAPGIPPAAPFIPGLLGIPNPAEDNRLAEPTPDDYARDNSFAQASLRFDFDLTDSMTLTSLTSFSTYDQDQTVDVDGQAIIGLQQRTTGKIDSFFQELRLGGSVNGRTHITVGLNYADDRTEEFNVDDISQSTLGVGTGLLTFNLRNDQDIETFAAFADVEYDLTDDLSVFGGIRYTSSDNEFTGCSLDSGDGTASAFFVNVLMLPPPGAGNCFSFDLATFSYPLIQTTLDEDNTSWRFGVDWAATDTTKVYATISRGYKAGGFPTLAATAAVQYDPTLQEELTAYEVGLRSEPSDEVRISTSIYYYDYVDKQVLGFTNDPVFGPLLRLNNVPESEVVGADFQLEWSPIEGLNLSAAASYVDSEVTSDYFSQDAFGVDANFRGEPFPNAPEFQFSADASYRWPVSDGLDAFVGLGMNHQDDTNSEFGQSPELDVDGYTLVDVRAGVESNEGRWRLSAWVRNVADEYYWSFASKTNDTFIRYTGMPRTYGATLTLSFGN
ncbi:MAG: TonB-dependent receptor [Pseudomonadota bacterium]